MKAIKGLEKSVTDLDRILEMVCQLSDDNVLGLVLDVQIEVQKALEELKAVEVAKKGNACICEDCGKPIQATFYQGYYEQFGCYVCGCEDNHEKFRKGRKINGAYS